MATATIAPVSVYSCVTLEGVDWETYTKLRDEPANDRIRMTYLDGTLIQMSPEIIHDRDIYLFDVLILGVAAGHGLGSMGIRSATLRRAGDAPIKGSGKEPDAAFYIGENERRLRGRKDLDLAVDPPPDLAIEIENKHDAELGLPVYARIGVPELWRYDVRRRSLWFGRLDDNHYREVDRSVILPRLTPSLVLEALDARDENDRGDFDWLVWLTGWARALPEPPAAA